ncbi:hypothetical protein DdX_03146 [Ditylenchus destructor]|uniref:Uncharacterized protein n=1 Tax=Ditylenchus destructor TaxID=166010 RepID=A0AAD4NJ97_9BILA|nr:hypothetical protein DdX_03146 [Ditylenchus destructor]
MDYNTNEEANILAKLGILNSTLECPNKKGRSKMDIKNISARSMKHTRAGNSGVLDEDSSDDCLFDNGLSTTILDSTLSNFAASNLSQIDERADFISGFSTVHGFCIVVGSILAGGLLISGAAGNRQRIFFCIYMAISLGSLLGSILNPPVEPIHYSTYVETQSNHSINKRETVINDTMVLSTTLPPPVINATNSTITSTTITAANPSLENEIVFKTKTEENMIKRKEAERRRKEKEEEERKKALEESKAETSTTSTTTTSTTTMANSTNSPTISTTTITTSTPSTSIGNFAPIASAPVVPPTEVSTSFTSKDLRDSASQENMTQPMWNVWPKIAPVIRRPTGHSAHIAALVLMSALILPSLLGFCCCQFILTTAADIPMLEMSQRAKQQQRSATEPIGCRILSGMIWAIHAMLESLILVFLPFQLLAIVDKTAGAISIIPVTTLVHFPSIFCRLLFAFRPGVGSHANVIHSFYLVSLLLSVILQHALPPSDIQICAVVLLSGLFASSIPLMVYCWQSNFLEANPMHISSRFLVYTSLGRLIAPYIFTWLISSNSKELPDIIAPFYNSFLLFQAIGYAVFIFLVTSAHKAKRQMQIIQLSGAINGQPSTSNASKTNTVTAKVKGQYKALIEEIDGSSDEGGDLAMDIISADDSDSDRSFV